MDLGLSRSQLGRWLQILMLILLPTASVIFALLGSLINPEEEKPSK